MKSYVLRVSRCTRPDQWLVLEMASSHSLEDLHQAIAGAFDLDQERRHGFFLSGRPWDAKSHYGDPGAGAPKRSAQATLGKLRLKRGRVFLYLQDYGEENWYRIRVWSAVKAAPDADLPRLLDRRGVAPGPQARSDGDGELPDGPPTAEERKVRKDLAVRLELALGRMFGGEGEDAEAALLRMLGGEEEDEEEDDGEDEEALERDYRLALEIRAWCGDREGRLAGLGLELDPDMEVTGWLAGLVEELRQRGETERALRLAREFAQVARPDLFLPLEAVLLADEGSQKKALALAEKILVTWPGKPRVAMRASEVFANCDRPERSAECQEWAFELCKDDPLAMGPLLEEMDALFDEGDFVGDDFEDDYYLDGFGDDEEEEEDLQDGPSASSLPPEEAVEILMGILEEHYRAWPDTCLPALDGKSPRQTVGTKKGRARVAALLAEMESAKVIGPGDRNLLPDLSKVWEDLGLERGKDL